VFLHEGHMFASSVDKEFTEIEPKLTSTMKANSLWKNALNGGWLKDLPPINSSFYVGWQLEQRGRTFQSYCHRAGLNCDKIPQDTSEFNGLPPLGGVYRGDAMCLDSRALLEKLLALYDVKSRIGGCQDIQIAESMMDHTELLVTAKTAAGSNSKQGKTYVRIHTKALALSAGAGNERLINLLNGPHSFDAETSRQQTVKTFMLVIRHLKAQEPLTAGFFPEFGGIFLVSRRDHEGKTVWLIGDKQRKLIPVPGESPAFDAVNWFTGLHSHLGNLVPRVFKRPEDYEWGIYEATKAERWTTNSVGEAGRLPDAFSLSKHAQKNVWLTWPTLLTFAPLVAETLKDDLITHVVPGQTTLDSEQWQKLHLATPPADCRWKRTPLMNWTKFNHSFGTA